MRYATLRNLAIVLAFEGAIAYAVAHSETSGGSPSFAELEMRLSHGVPLIRVDSAGKTGYVILDSGSSVSSVDEAFFANLHPRDEQMTAHTYHGDVDLPLYDPPEFNVGPICFAKRGAVVRTDLSKSSSRIGYPIIAIVGAPAIKDFVIQLDYDTKSVRFIRADQGRHNDWGTELPIKWTLGVPTVRAEFGGLGADLVVDTAGGAADLGLPPEVFDRLVKRDHFRLVVESGVGVAGPFKYVIMRMAITNFAGFTYRNLLVEQCGSSLGFVGSNFLSRHVVTLDLAHDCICLQPSKGVDRFDDVTMSGLSIAVHGNTATADSVDFGSPAYEAGMRDGDILFRVNGRPIKDYTASALRKLLRAGEGREVTVVYRRGEGEHTATFKLRRRI